MPGCEKCWRDSARGPYSDHAEDYRELIHQRRDNPCSPEEQAGEYATLCVYCDRRTVHQHAHVCMVCGKEGGGR